ncbi:serine hydrolase domain-containing protein [Thermodesulfobacteriota bacterium]
MFTSQDIDKTNGTIKIFPVSTEISVAKINGSSVSYYGAIKRKDRIETRNNKNSKFEIGSITKLFTSTVLAQMSMEHLLEIDDPIDLKLGFPLKNNSKITYKELSTHRSGLPRIPFDLLVSLIFKKTDNPYRDYSEDKLIKYLKNDLRIKNKGKFKYSNLGAGLLGYVLSKQSAMSFDALLKQRVFSQLNMVESTTIRDEVKEQLVMGLNKKGKPTANWDLNIFAGAGAVISSVSDLSKFIVANIEGSNEALNYQRQIISENKKHSMGLGWFILINKIPGIDRVYFHNGGTGGYRSSLVADFEKGHGIIILSNISAANLFKANKVDKLALNLLKNMN